MKADYKNWVPKKMIVWLAIASAVFFVLCAVCGSTHLIHNSVIKTVVTLVFLAVMLVCIYFLVWAVRAYKAFSYQGNRKLARDIIEYVAAYAEIPEEGKGLDVGCGSGASTIACARRNPQAQMIGVDRWGKEYDFSRKLCEANAEAEGVQNVSFQNGDARHLPFPDETFDFVTSNYVYHNIAGTDRQKLLKESFRVLKKGGTFAIHDLMRPGIYGDLEQLDQELKDVGFERVGWLDTTKQLMTPKEAHQYMLDDSTLLYGKK